MGGCKSSELRVESSAVNPGHLPPVPLDSWYAKPFSEQTQMPMTMYHETKKGQVVFSEMRIPSKRSDLAQLPNGAPNTKSTFVLGHEAIYGMGYLHNTALYIEHAWRTRVNHSSELSRFDRPFYNMLIGIKIFVNNVLVPDLHQHEHSLPQCSTTYKAHEAAIVWRCVPFVLVPLERSFMIENCTLYAPLVDNFIAACLNLPEGNHNVVLHVVYGCRSENNFCTDFISRGGCTITMASGSREKLRSIRGAVSGAIDQRPNLFYRNNTRGAGACVYCGAPLAYRCTVCNAQVCGTVRCVYSSVAGYPFGCQNHRAVMDQSIVSGESFDDG